MSRTAHCSREEVHRQCSTIHCIGTMTLDGRVVILFAIYAITGCIAHWYFIAVSVIFCSFFYYSIVRRIGSYMLNDPLVGGEHRHAENRIAHKYFSKRSNLLHSLCYEFHRG